MGLAQKQILVSSEEYLLMERNASFKSEFFHGQVYAMAGGSIAHNGISENIFASFHSHLKNKDCRPFNSDQRIKISIWPSFLYPDVSVVCGKPEILDKDNISNPVIIVEVLSDSTEEYDRVLKYGQYRQIPSLREYILISSKEKKITKYSKPNGTECWTESVYDLKNNLPLHIESIHLTLPLEAIYYNIELDAHLSIR